MTLWRRSLTALVVLLTFAAQPGPVLAQQAPVFRAGVELVTLPVIVVDRDGRPARGLAAEDFIVRLGGKPRPVRTVTFVETAAPPAPPPRAGGGDVSNTGGGRTGPVKANPRLLVFGIDDLSFRFISSDLQLLRSAVEKTLAQLGPLDRVGLVTTSGEVVVNPTVDRASITAALRRVRGLRDDPAPEIVMSMDEAAAVMRENNPKDMVTAAVSARECPIVFPDPRERAFLCDGAVAMAARTIVENTIFYLSRQVRSLVGIARQMAEVPGPKTLVVISAGLATELSTLGLSEFGTTLAEGGVQLYVVSGAGDDVTFNERESVRVPVRVRDDRSLRAGVDDLAGAAGAPRLVVVGRPDAIFERILSETSAYYVLGVDAPELPEGRTPLATVDVRRQGLTVRTHKNAVVRSAPAEVLTTQQQVSRALRDGTPLFAVPLTVATSVRRSADATRVELGVNVVVPGDIPGPVELNYAVVDRANRRHDSGTVAVPTPKDQGEYRVSFGANVPAGEFTLRLVAADAVGGLGSVELPVRARLWRTGRFFASDMQLFSVERSGDRRFLALERIPASAAQLGFSVELYGDVPAGASGPAVRFDLRRSGEDRVLATRTSDAVQAGRVWRASGLIDLAALDAGAFTLTATVLENAVEVGAVSASMRTTPPDDAAPVAAPPPASPPATSMSAGVLVDTLRKDAALPPAFDRAPLLAVADAHTARVRAEHAGAAAGFARSLDALRRGDVRTAMTGLDEVATLVPSSTSVLLFQGVAYAISGRDREAAGAWQMGLFGDGVEDVWAAALVDSLGRLGEVDEAASVLEQVLTQFPGSLPLQLRRVQRGLAAGRHTDVSAVIEPLLKTHPGNPELLYLQVAAAFLDAAAPEAAPSAIERFRALAAAYAGAGHPKAEVVNGWLRTVVR